MTTLLAQIIDITSVNNNQCLDVTIYQLGMVENVTFPITYSDLTAKQKITVDAFKSLMISLNPNS